MPPKRGGGAGKPKALPGRRRVAPLTEEAVSRKRIKKAYKKIMQLKLANKSLFID